MCPTCPGWLQGLQGREERIKHPYLFCLVVFYQPTQPHSGPIGGAVAHAVCQSNRKEGFRSHDAVTFQYKLILEKKHRWTQVKTFFRSWSVLNRGCLRSDFDTKQNLDIDLSSSYPKQPTWRRTWDGDFASCYGPEIRLISGSIQWLYV